MRTNRQGAATDFLDARSPSEEADSARIPSKGKDADAGRPIGLSSFKASLPEPRADVLTLALGQDMQRFDQPPSVRLRHQVREADNVAAK